MVSREDLVTQSVTEYVRAGLVARGYPTTDWVMVESYSADRIQDLLRDGKQVIATGFNFDAAPVAAECGSDLTSRIYHLEFYVLGTTATYAKNLSSVIKFIIDNGGDGGTIPLNNYEQAGAPQIDTLVVAYAVSRREPIPDPEPWQEHLWLAQAQVEDIYHAALT